MIESFDNSKFVAYLDILRNRHKLNNKVLLVQAPQFMPDSFDITVARNRGYYAYPPTGLQCIAKALSGRGLEVDILDLNYEFLKRAINDNSFDHRDWLNILGEYLEKDNHSIIGVTCISIYTDVFKTRHPLTMILEYLHKRDRDIIMAGGPIATNEYRNYLLKDLAHFVFEGEGENKVNFFFDNLFDCESKRRPVKGIYFKFNGGIEETQGHMDKVGLSGNLIGTYDKILIERYSDIGSLNPYSRMAGQEKRFSVFQLNRGCRANCKFCGVPEFMGKGVRHYPVKDVLDETKYLVQKRGIRYFDVLDDDFLVNIKEVIELLKGLIELRNEYGITWSSNNGLIAASITEELMALMRDSGCVGFRIGVESGSPQMLKKLRKPANLALIKKSAVILNKFPEVFSGGNYIIGLLGEETFGEMLDTFRFMHELNLDWASIAVFQFTSSKIANTKHLKKDKMVTTDFQPTKYSARGEIEAGKDMISGPDIFKFPLDRVPTYEEVKQIWFSFNLVANYINNKSLKENGNPRKFTSWVEAVKLSYPLNPYMSLFAGIGRMLCSDTKSACRHLDDTRRILQGSEYWNRRFSQFNLNNVVNSFPQNAEGTREVLAELRKRYLAWGVAT